MSDKYQPPCTITPEIVSLVAEISQTIGRLSARAQTAKALRLRRVNRIRAVQGSLAIEGNTLSTEQITAILEGKRVLAPAKEIQEARNALLAYERMESWNPTRLPDLRAAHELLMAGLIDAPGSFRTGGAGIMKGQAVIHLAPGAERVPLLVKDLLRWLKVTDHHPLISSSIFHYEFEFIHPFPDGNGRMGRLWQTLILARWNPVLSYMPVETMVHQNQTEYYRAINQSTAHADSAHFVRYMLKMILEASLEAASVSEKMSEKMSEKILRLIAEQPTITIAELAHTLGVASRTIERTLKSLQDQARLRRVGPAKGGRWEVMESS